MTPQPGHTRAQRCPRHCTPCFGVPCGADALCLPTSLYHCTSELRSLYCVSPDAIAGNAVFAPPARFLWIFAAAVSLLYTRLYVAFFALVHSSWHLVRKRKANQLQSSCCTLSWHRNKLEILLSVSQIANAAPKSCVRAHAHTHTLFLRMYACTYTHIR